MFNRLFDIRSVCLEPLILHGKPQFSTPNAPRADIPRLPGQTGDAQECHRWHPQILRSGGDRVKTVILSGTIPINEWYSTMSTASPYLMVSVSLRLTD